MPKVKNGNTLQIQNGSVIKCMAKDQKCAKDYTCVNGCLTVLGVAGVCFISQYT